MPISVLKDKDQVSVAGGLRPPQIHYSRTELGFGGVNDCKKENAHHGEV